MTARPTSVAVRAAAARLLDIALAAAVLTAAAPAMLLIALAIVADSGCPVFFVQTRIGREGRTFAMYKFRKFGPLADDKGCPLTLENDARMTKVGRILARTKLDELPQLFNILRGEMSIVGPRPESLAFADCFTELERAVLNYRPGIFGPSQVAFRRESRHYPPDADLERFYRDTLFPTKAALDLGYYPRRTILADFGWMLRGVLAVAGVQTDRGDGRYLSDLPGLFGAPPKGKVSP